MDARPVATAKAAGLRIGGTVLPLPPGTAACLCCGWLPADGDAGTVATAHTRATRHPTLYRPPARVARRSAVPDRRATALDAKG